MTDYSSCITCQKVDPHRAIMRRLDLAMLMVLWVATLLFKFEKVPDFSWILYIRYMIIVYLYFRLFTAYNRRLSHLLFWVSLFLLYTGFVGINTGLLFGWKLAFTSFARFISVALFAPLLAVLPLEYKDFSRMLIVLLVLIVVAFFMVVYQLLGGELGWLIHGYVSTRGGAQRFMTLLGNPNATGMGAVILYIISIFWIRHKLIKGFCIVSAILLIVFSLSKSAMVFGLLVTVIAIFEVFKRVKRANKVRYGYVIFATGILGIILGALFLFPGAANDIGKYAKIGYQAVTGKGSIAKSSDLVGAIRYRLVTKVQEGVVLAEAQSGLGPIGIIVGNSFGVAGSVSNSSLGSNKAILPHNSFLEIYLVGGFIMLLIFSTIILLTLKRLFYCMFVRNPNDRNFITLSYLFLALTLYSFVWPVVYQAFIGSVFWFIIGCVANRELMQKLVVEG